MLGHPTFRELEYTALMERVRDIARSASSSWTLSTIGSAAFLAWAAAAKNPGILLPAVMCAACGYYVTLHARRETMLLEGYLQETFERDDAQWHTKREQVRSLPGIGHTTDPLPLAQSQLVAMLSILLGWLFAKHVPNGELLAGLTTSAAVAFGLHSVTEHLRYAHVTSSAYWAQVTGGPREVRPDIRKAAA
jgi:hypothetical protein